MRDEIDGRIWTEHHTELSASLDRLFRNIGNAFRRLHDIQFSAPWRNSGGGARHA